MKGHMRSILRPLLIVLGTIAVILGVVGMFVPILPTTPFLLLAAACYARSSDRFLHWLLNNRYFGAYIRNYREGRGMPKATKIFTLAALWLTLGMSALFATSSPWLRLLLAAIGIGVTIHLLRLKTYALRPGATHAAVAPPAAAPSDDV
jgi:uncharacterized protein